jgi:hypothetical protein
MRLEAGSDKVSSVSVDKEMDERVISVSYT